MKHGILSCLTIVLLNANTTPAVVFAQPQPQLPPPPVLPPLTQMEMPRSQWTEPLWLRGLRWLSTEGIWSIYAVAGGAAALRAVYSAGRRSARPARSAKPIVLIVGGLIACAGLGLFFFAIRSEEAVFLPFGAVVLVFFGLTVAALGLPRPSDGDGA
jgi:hypothetical protein